MEQLTDMLIRHEGERLLPYIDPRGFWTIGVGHNLTKPITHRAAMVILEDDIKDAENDCLHAFPWFAALDDTRKLVMLNLMFNMGLPTLLKFVNFLRSMEQGDYDEAATHLLDSRYAEQVKGRAKELATMLRMPVSA